MKCVHCGANIPDDQMICPVCGAEVQIVPDYNPLDDVLAREVRGSVEGATRQIRTDDIRRYRREDLTKNINSTRVLSEDEMERIRSNRRKGYRAVNEKEYMAAEKYFDRAIIKDKSRPDAYVGLAEIYLDQNDTDGAEDVYLSAIETQPTNEKLYQAAIDFYMETKQPEKVASLLEDCEDDNVLASVSEYVCEAPEFKPEEGTYKEVQEITISSDTEGEIYYTTDGTDPTAKTGKKYKEPILLEKEGTTEIRAIVVNMKGIPSGVISQTYTIEFPIADAPAVTPSTGRYTDPQKITITVPDGYTAYYTTDGSEPTASSEKYTGPIDMPANTTTTFNAVLINNRNGKATEVTTRSYITTAE